MTELEARKAVAVLDYLHSTQDAYWSICCEERRLMRARYVECLVEGAQVARRLEGFLWK